jgi:POT family proton-dependent oligopeptide transporter
VTNGVEKTWFGHPKGLFYLAFTEAWERFSFYGMTGLVVLYMVNQLLLPGHVEHIAGFTAFRRLIESVAGPQSTQALASQIFGLYSGFVYFTPVLGGMVADRWIGQRNAVVIGALSMSAGHVAMAADRTFLLALLLLVVGSGFLKGNISSQVGALYPPADESRRSRGFIIFSTGINIGAVAGPVICGFLAQVYGWHHGFGVAAIFMLLGLVTYLYGYRTLPARVARPGRDDSRLTAGDWRAVRALVAVIAVTVLPTIAHSQIYNVGPVWTQASVQAHVGGFQIPVPWYQALYSLSSILCMPAILWLWRRQAARQREPHDVTKIGIGAGMAAASNLILVAAISWSGDALVHPVWPLLYCVGLGTSFMYYWPTLLALVSRLAPPRLNATMIGIAFMSHFVANSLIGWIGSFYERMSPSQFWGLHASIAATGAVMALVLGRSLSALRRAT